MTCKDYYGAFNVRFLSLTGSARCNHTKTSMWRWRNDENFNFCMKSALLVSWASHREQSLRLQQVTTCNLLPSDVCQNVANKRVGELDFSLFQLWDWSDLTGFKMSNVCFSSGRQQGLSPHTAAWPTNLTGLFSWNKNCSISARWIWWTDFSFSAQVSKPHSHSSSPPVSFLPTQHFHRCAADQNSAQYHLKSTTCAT